MRLPVERLQRTEVQVVIIVAVTAVVLLASAAGAPRPVVVALAIAGLVGLAAGGAWLRIHLRRAEELLLPPADDTDEMPPQTEQMIYVATPSVSSSTSRRLMRIRSHTAPMAPPDLEIQLVIEEYDHVVRLPVTGLEPGSHLPSLLVEPLRALVEEHRPTEIETRFVLTGARSEGPLDPSGCCSWGWTFYFVDGSIGLGCAVTITAYDVSLQYHSAPTHYASETEGPIEAARALAAARRDLPELMTSPLWLRFNQPADHLVFQHDPLWIADVDVESDAVRNVTGFRRRMLEEPNPGESWTIDDLLAWSRGEERTAPALARALEDDAFATGLRTHGADAFVRAARGLWRAHGAETVSLLWGVIVGAEQADEAALFTKLLARVPSGLATAALHRLSESPDAERVHADAHRLFEARRQRQLGVGPDPIEGLNFVESRRAMGKSCNLRPLPLRSVFDEEALVAPLEEAGLRVTRRRIVSGQFPVLHGIFLRGVRGDIEGLISTNALPVPCHVLHLAGGAADAFAQRIDAAGLVYPEAEIRADACSERPHLVHRAALYMAALRLDVPDCLPSFRVALERGRNDINLRRAIFLALEHVVSVDPSDILQPVAGDPDDRLASLARSILQRRGLPLAPPSA